MKMTKAEAIRIFGKVDKDLAAPLRISRQAIGQWPADLTTDQIERVLGACILIGAPIPDKFIKPYLLKNRLSLVKIVHPE